MKSAITTLALLTAVVLGSGTVEAGTRCQQSPATNMEVTKQAVCHYVYHVEYFVCSCSEWRCYGKYEHKCDAIAAAKKLAYKGYDTRVLKYRR